VPPCLLGVRRGISYLWREFGSGARCGLVRDEDRTQDETADRSARLRALIRDRIREWEHHLGVPTARRFTQVGGSEFLFKPDGLSGTGPLSPGPFGILVLSFIFGIGS
jgi:hypothetical protein